MVQMNQSPSAPLPSGPVLMGSLTFHRCGDVMELLIVMTVQMNQSPSAPLHVQLICLLVLIAVNVLVFIESVMEWLNVRMDLMNLKLFAPRHAQLICLLVLMA